MKINLSPFDPGSNKELGKIINFVNWCVQSISTLTRVFRNNIELEDNINGDKVSVTLSSGVQTTTNIKGSPYGIQVMRARGASVDSFEWGYLSNGSIFVTCYFKDSDTNITVDLYVWRN